MEGTMEVSYVVLCANDTQLSVSLDDLLANEKVARTIRGEFAKGIRNLMLEPQGDAQVLIKTAKTTHTFTAAKNDFADLVELAEEDARKNKYLKKGCEGVELVDIVTVD